MRRASLPAIILSAALIASACTAGRSVPEAAASPSTTPTTVALSSVPSSYVGFLHQPAACGAETPDPAVDMQFDAPDDMAVTGPIIVRLATSCGPIDIALDPTDAPETVNSFVFLAEQGYFDGTVTHRVVPGFMVQFGDPTATGLGGPGYTVPDEYPDGSDYRRGVVAMANAGPGTTGSQFFILFGDATWLPPTFTIIGEVVSGFPTLDKIEGVPLGRGANSADPEPSTPLESVFIESISVL